MLSREDNETICRVGRGTAMGELFRRFWLPALASGDLPERDGAPLRLRVLGENLLAFRDSDGDVGVIDAVCPHRRAKLFWGRNEERGIRCAYHGWKFDVHGQCVDMPSEPGTSRYKEQIQVPSYEAVDRGGLIWVYMGPPQLRPEFPRYEWFDLPAEQVSTRSSFQDSNWLQSLEGDIDTAHVSFLHRWLDPDSAPSAAPQMHEGYRHFVVQDTAPHLAMKDTDYGFIYGGRRSVGDSEYYWRLSHWIAPGGSAVPGNQYRPVRFLTPIDDEHAMSLSVGWNESLPVAGGPPASGLEPVQLPDGYVIDVRVAARNRRNDYQIDRDLQRTTTFTGITGGPADQDRAMTETMEPILDRSDEHLGTTDVAIIALRRMLLTMAWDLAAGIEPRTASNDAPVRFRGLDHVTPSSEFADVLGELAGQLVGDSPGATA